MYVVTRRDLSPGQQATQSVHAAIKFARTFDSITRHWYEDSNYLVLLTVADEAALYALAEEAGERRIVGVANYEPDLDHALTALVFEPTYAAQQLCANLPLTGREVAMA